MYIAMFPQLVAGPIVRYADIEHEIDNRRATLEGFAQGLRLFCVGLGKKVLLANTAGVLGRLAVAPRGGRDRLYRLLLGRGCLHLPDLL